MNSGYSRYSLRINSGYKINDKLSVGFNLAPTYSTRYQPPTDGWNRGERTGILIGALASSPMLKYKNDDGTLPLTTYLPGSQGTGGLGGYTFNNFYRSLEEIKFTNNTSRVLSNAFILLEPIKGLSLKTSINVEYGNNDSKQWNPSTSSIWVVSIPPITAAVSLGIDSFVSWLSETTATYKRSVGNHNFELLAGYTSQKYTIKSMAIRATNFPDDRINDVDAASVIQLSGTDSDLQEWSLISYISRLNYDFKGKYLVSAAIRRDGSSRFGINNKWGNFPSVSLGWIVSEENFFPKNKAVNFIKVRGSYGLTGNNNIGNYTSFASVNLGANTVFGSTIAPGSYVSSLSNLDLGWEKTSQVDIGADIAILNNRISLAYDYYLKRTYDMLYQFAIPESSGFSQFTGNSGELKFWGHEIAVTSRNITGKFNWTTSANITFGDSKVISLAPNVDALYTSMGNSHISKVGERLGMFYGMVVDGVYDNQEEFDNSPKAAQSVVGSIKFKDMNNDGVILNTGGDLVVIGDPTPKFLFGITNEFGYKKFDLSFVMSGSYGNDIANWARKVTNNIDGKYNVLREVKDRWRSPENPGLGKHGTTIQATGMERDWFNTNFINDGSYLTIKNVNLGYNVSSNKLKFISSIRVYASIQQLYVFTKYEGNNPEITSDSNVLNLGEDYTSYPVPRTYTFGVNLGF
jgi:TonB-linked SusC/RagA family outer membrane protein